jgi:hypothetical protein
MVAPAKLKMIGAGAILERPVIEKILTHLGLDRAAAQGRGARSGPSSACQTAAGVALPARNKPATVENPYRGCLHLQAGRFKSLICKQIFKLARLLHVLRCRIAQRPAFIFCTET